MSTVLTCVAQGAAPRRGCGLLIFRQGAFLRAFGAADRRAVLHVIPNRAEGFTRHPEPSRRFYTSSRTEGAREGSPRLLPPVPCEGIPRFANFAPSGLVRRFVEMLLQAGISPRVGRNDERGVTQGNDSRSFPLISPFGTASRRRKERRRQRSRFLPAMAKTSVRHARTPHRGDAHNARLTPQGEAFTIPPYPPFAQGRQDKS